MTVEGLAYIIEENPELSAIKVPFDVTKTDFKNNNEKDTTTYNIRTRGLFYGFLGIKDRLRKRMTVISVYNKGISEPKTFDEPLVTVKSGDEEDAPEIELSSEILKMMAGEVTTGNAIKSLRSTKAFKVNWKWILIGVVGLIITIVALMYGPQIVSSLRGMV